MSAKLRLTTHCTPAMVRKLHAAAKRNGCSVSFLIEAYFRMAIQCFDGKTTDLIKMLAQVDAKPTTEKALTAVTVRLAPEVYEGLQRLHSRARLRWQKRR
jgi:hypothetical protein